tara:strand:- start:562 stop:1251 length:690 start_codon:yes stop_codon:yes gene_type:complete
MKAFIIYQKENPDSVKVTKVLKESIEQTQSAIDVELFNGTTPSTIDKDIPDSLFEITYTYPRGGQRRYDKRTNLLLTGYNATSTEVKLACTLSHARLWNKCVELDEEIMILEHDALFLRKFEPFEWEGGILGLNDPRGATRKSMVFHTEASKVNGISTCPFVDTEPVPQGLAGNSAYIIKPFAAKHLLDKLEEFGAWPNDALMCNQVCPWLKVIYPYYTRVQGGISTTT